MTSDLRTVIARRAVESGGRLRVQSALNPALWLCGIITAPAMLVLGLSPTPPSWLIWVIYSPIVLAAFGFLFLLFFDRDKLQSEDYQLKKKSLEMIEQKGMAGPTMDQTIAIVSPDEVKQLRQGDGE